MTDKELKSLRRADLLEMLIESEKLRANAATEYTRAIEELRAQVEELNAKLAERTITVEDSGNLAEACLRLNGVLSSAQNAADQYLENITSRHQNIDEECSEKLAACQEEALSIIAETREKCMMLEKKAEEASYEIIRQAEEKRRQTEAECERMRIEARRYADSYFREKNGKLQQVLSAYSEVESLINSN